MGAFPGENASSGLACAEVIARGVDKRVVVLGATSLVGLPLLARLKDAGFEVLAISRKVAPEPFCGVEWHCPEVLSDPSALPDAFRSDALPWICLAPLWVLCDYLQAASLLKPSRIIALSSTSRFSKENSTVPAEREVATRLALAEEALMDWCAQRSLSWLILRPTLIHGFGRDRNVADIARFISRYQFFPVLGKAAGLRRPVHANELADACLLALLRTEVSGRALTISGGEALSYAAMVERVFLALGRKPRLVYVPRWLLRLGLTCLHPLGLARAWTIGMADRMNQDLAYSHEEATDLLGFHPGPFVPDKSSLC